MSKSYRDRRDSAKRDANERLSGHYMTEEPVRSYRFHARTTAINVKKRQDGAYPFVKIHPPTESVSFPYSSFYAFTLTWTPGHMTIVGDIGQLTVVHYHAMPTLEDACNWLQTCDFDYLLSKTNESRVYDGEQTFAWFKQMLSEQVFDHALGTPGWDSKQRRANGDIHELRSWRKHPPKWNKRSGQTKADFENERRWYLDDKPKSTFSDHERDCWEWWRRLADYTGYQPEDVCIAKYRRRMLARVREQFNHEQLAADFLWRHMSLEDPSLIYEYRPHAFFQIAAIQHGARMILDRHSPRLEVAA
ncbi:hypothetical protein IB276_10915 [Ensifer sp. ENS04]|uniref:hypothetical protein n=1 Tax=Ensifer sp. ENS04 TaxID=2769281 RepID=UPI00177ED7EE|nr:hypothetical protein [Ensifer sp. ENS04]MBD9539962.1 hypothetical protein [Ensifer sp. ENS04]